MNAVVKAELQLNGKDNTAQAFRALAGRLEAVTKKAAAFERANNALGRARGIERQVAAHGRLRDAIQGSETAIVGYGKVVAGVAVAGGIAAAAKSSVSFETSLYNIQKKGGYAADVMQRIGEEAKALSVSGEVAAPLSEILAGYERGAAAGIPIAELKEFVLLTTKVADAFEMAGDESANAFLGFNKTIGLSFGEMERYADLINSLADSGIADERNIVNFIDRAGAGLSAFGLSKNQIAGLGATSANIKMPDDVAANALTTLTGKLLSPGSDKAEKALAGIVGNLGEFRKILKTDANKALELFLTNVGKLDKFKGAELLSGFVGAGFDDEIMRYAAAIDEVRRNRELAEGSSWFGSLDASYQGKLKLAESQLKIFQNELGKLAIDVGTMGLPALKSALEDAGEVVRKIGENIDSFGEKLDRGALADAAESLSKLKEGLEGVLSMDTSGSAIDDFFRDVAQVTNDVAAGIKIVSDGLAAIKSLMPGGGDDAPSGKTVYGNGAFSIGVEKGSLGERIVDSASRVWNFEKPEDQFGAVASGKSGRVGGDPDPARFGDELRSAIESGGSSVEAAGISAGMAIAESGDAIAAKITAAGNAAGDAIAGKMQAAISGGIRVNAPYGTGMAPLANRAPATTMSDAGQAGG